MKHSLLLLALLPLASWAQAPSLTTATPGRNAKSAPRTGPIYLTFSAPVTGAATLRVMGSMWKGHRAGTPSGDGTSTLSFRPQQAFAPGEQVSVTVPASVRSAGTGGEPLAGGQVFQFLAAAGPATGTFGPQIVAGNQAGGTGRYDPTLADINNDGILDLLHTDVLAGNTVKLYLGTGQGQFDIPVGIRTGSEPFSLTTADFDHDGNLDLVTSGWGGPVIGYTVAVAMGDGTGRQAGFTRHITLPVTGGQAIEPRIGDVNADGNPDIVFIEHAPSTTPSSQAHSSLLVRLGNGQGSFTSLPAMVLPWLGANAGRGILKLADINNDGNLDCLLANASNSRLDAYLGNGRGTFTAVSSPVGAAFPLAHLADLTGDGVLDAVCVSNNTASLYPGTGQGTFASTATASLSVPGFYAAQSADIDGDGDLDLLFAERPPFPNGGFSKDVHVWANNGAGTFSSGPRMTGAVGLFATGDVNNDGTMDAVVIDYNDGFMATRLNLPLANAPTLTAFTPNMGSTGTVVTITGTNFTGATSVLIGGVPVAGYTVVNGTTISFPLPGGSPSGLMTVITPTGQATSATPFMQPTATRSATNTLSVELFPNPAHSSVQVQLPSTGPLQVAFYNSLGQCVRRVSTTLPTSTTTLDLQGLASGLYTLKLQSGGRSAIQQLVVE